MSARTRRTSCVGPRRPAQRRRRLADVGAQPLLERRQLGAPRRVVAGFAGSSGRLRRVALACRRGAAASAPRPAGPHPKAVGAVLRHRSWRCRRRCRGTAARRPPAPRPESRATMRAGAGDRRCGFRPRRRVAGRLGAASAAATRRQRDPHVRERGQLGAAAPQVTRCASNAARSATIEIAGVAVQVRRRSPVRDRR